MYFHCVSTRLHQACPLKSVLSVSFVRIYPHYLDGGGDVVGANGYADWTVGVWGNR